MPCYTNQSMSVKLEASNRNTLKKSLKELGHEFEELDDGTIVIKKHGITIGKDTINFKMRQVDTVDAIRRKYTERTLNKEGRERRVTVQWHNIGTNGKLIFS